MQLNFRLEVVGVRVLDKEVEDGAVLEVLGSVVVIDAGVKVVPEALFPVVKLLAGAVPVPEALFPVADMEPIPDAPHPLVVPPAPRTGIQGIFASSSSSSNPSSPASTSSDPSWSVLMVHSDGPADEADEVDELDDDDVTVDIVVGELVLGFEEGRVDARFDVLPSSLVL